MGAKAEALATRFEAKAREATEVIERLSDADWQKVTAAEKWPVGVVAHHMAGAHEIIAGIAKSIADGTAGPPIAMADLDEMNAKHAVEHANCTKSETLALHRKNAAAAAAIVRGIRDGDLDRPAPVLTGMPPMSAEQLAGVLVQHVDEHLGSIRATVGVGAPAAPSVA